MKSSDGYRRRRFELGEVLVIEGQDAMSAFLIESGTVEIFKTVHGEDVVLSQLSAGQIFGETALLYGEKRTASARATSEGGLIVIDRSVFKAKLEKSDPTIRAIMTMLSERLLTTNNALVAEQRDAQSLLAAARTVFDNICDDLPQIEKRLFEEGVKPQFEAFVSAVEALQERIDKRD